jgi:phage terminase large subunit-like protein
MSKKPKDYVAIAKRYAEGVVSGKIPACSWVRKACQRQLDDLARWKDSGPFAFDRRKANRICAFVEMLPHIKGEWAKRGERLTLQPWQVFIYATVFGWVRRDSGLRRYRIAYLEMARKQGKSSMSSPVGIYMTGADGEAGSEVYSAATTRDQAKVVWETAKHMVEREPGLRAAFGIDTSAHSIFQARSGSRFQALSAEGNSLDGLNIHCAIVDELHAHRTRKVYDVLETARGARLQPLLWLITTAGFDRSGICYEQRTYLTKILDRVVEDETYFGMIYTLDEGDDWKDERNWIKANPNLEISVYLDELRPLALKAQKMASAQNNFLTKHMSVWVNADTTLFNADAWRRLGDPSLDADDFAGEPCWIGLDLAPQHDFTSRVLLFRRDGEYYVFARHFLGEGEIERSDNSQYAGWAADGWITACAGETTSYDDVEDDLRDLNERFRPLEAAYDPYTAKEILDHMQAEGINMVEMRPIVANFSEATKRLGALISEGRIHHDGDTALTWMISNVVGRYDRKDNVFPAKERRESKIDGAIALIMALGRAMTHPGGRPESVYEVRGPQFV